MTVKVVVQDANVEVVLQDPPIVVELGDSGPQGPPGARGSQVLSGDVDPTSVVGLVGDQYINTATGKIFGPKTASGWGEGVFLIDPENLGQIHIQSSPSSTWNITHDLNFVPNLTIDDKSNRASPTEAGTKNKI